MSALVMASPPRHTHSIITVRMRAIARIGVIARLSHMWVRKKGKNEMIEFDFRTGVGVIAQGGCETTPGDPHFEREVACCRE